MRTDSATRPAAAPACPGTPGQRAGAVFALSGGTPAVPLRFAPAGLVVWVKCEFPSPSGNSKGRFTAPALADAGQSGVLRPDPALVQCTSGNTGIALAMIGTSSGASVAGALRDVTDPGPDHTGVTRLCDRAGRFCGTRLLGGHEADSSPAARRAAP